MRVDNQSSTLYLLKLAFRSAKLSHRQVLTTLLLIVLLATSSLYITNQIYQGNKPGSSTPSKSEPAKDTKPTSSPKKKPVSASKSLHQPQPLYITLKLRQERQRKEAALLKSELQAKVLDELKINLPQSRSKLDKREAEKLTRHELILSYSDEEAKLQFQDQQSFPEEAYSPPPEEEWAPPSPQQKPSFWRKVAKEIYHDMQRFYRNLFRHEPLKDALKE